MNFNAELAWSFFRALAIAAVALAIAGPLARALSGLRARKRTVAWVLLLAPALTPSIVTGYTLARGWLAGGARAGWNEALYAVVLLLKLVPLAAVAQVLIPSPATPASRHCYHLLGPQPFARDLRFRLLAAGRGPAAALILIFLLAFTEFELAALCNVRSWTVVLFDAHAGGLSLTASLRLSAMPAAIEALALAALWFSIRGARPAVAPRFESAPHSINAITGGYLVFAATCVTLLPLAQILHQAAPGFAAVVDTFTLGTDLAASATFAFGASISAWLAVRQLARKPARAAVCSLPGLLGALVLSLLILGLFQLPTMRAAYDTLLPLLLALTLLLVPLALLLRWILDAARPGSAVFIAGQSGRHDLVWRLDGRRRFAAWAVLFCWAFFDFTAASILAPVGFTPVFVRLHNLMHYGQTAVLSAMVCAAFATPLAVLLLTGAFARFYARQHGR